MHERRWDGLSDGLNDPGGLVRRTKSRHQQRIAPGKVVLLRNERRRRGAKTRDERRDALGCISNKVATEPQRRTSLVEGPEEEPEIDHRSHPVQLELEGRDDPAVSATATQGPEQLRVLVGGSHDRLALRGHHLCGDQIVCTETSLAREPADAPATGQTGHAGGTDEATGYCQAMGLCRGV